MKVQNLKFKKFLSLISKAAVFVVLVFVIFAPFQVALNTPTNHVSLVKSEAKAALALSDTPKACADRGGTWSYLYGDCYTDSSNSKKLPPTDNFGCGWDTNLDLGVCLSNVVYVFTVGLGSGFAYIGAFVFDTTVNLSLNSAAYALDFLSSGWTAARDIANMAFILILVYIAFMVMFEAETAGTVRMLAWVIFIALIINFSFFFTRVVIDTGNILGVQFYNSIQAPTFDQTFSDTNSQTGVLANTATGVANAIAPSGVFKNTKDLTASIMGALNIQDLFNNTSFNAFIGNNSGVSGFMTKLIVLSILYIFIGIAYFILGTMFLAVGIKFLFRIVVLWFLIIASPLALIAKAVPNPAVKKYYDQWQHHLITHAFYPAVFLFIFFFISTVMKGLSSGQNSILGGLATDLKNLSTSNVGGVIYITSAIANVGIRLGFVIAMLYIALKASEAIGVIGAGAAQNVTSKISGAVKTGMRFGGGLPVRGAAATAAVLGRNTLGWTGNKVARSALLEGWEKNAAFGFLARGARATGTFVGNRTFDARNVPGASAVLGVGGLVDAGKGQKGGYIKRVEESAKAKEKHAKEMEPTAGEELKARQQAEKEYASSKESYEQKSREETEKRNKIQKDINEAQNKLKNVANKTSPEATDLEEQIKKAQDKLAEKDRDDKTISDRIKEANDALKVIETKTKARADDISGKGRSKEYAKNALLNPLNIGAGNPLFVTRASREAAAKILKGKSTDQKAKELLEEIAKEKKESEGGGDPEGGGTGGGKGKGGGGDKSGDGGDKGADKKSGGDSHGGGTSASLASIPTTSFKPLSTSSELPKVELSESSLRDIKGLRKDVQNLTAKLAPKTVAHLQTPAETKSTASLNERQFSELTETLSNSLAQTANAIPKVQPNLHVVPPKATTSPVTASITQTAPPPRAPFKPHIVESTPKPVIGAKTPTSNFNHEANKTAHQPSIAENIPKPQPPKENPPGPEQKAA